jgi:hypothetical protein
VILERPWGWLHYLDEGSGPLVVLLHLWVPKTYATR